MPPETMNLPLITREASLRLVRGEGDDMTIDVIWTTGATVHAAAEALRRAGVARVDAWVCARAP